MSEIGTHLEVGERAAQLDDVIIRNLLVEAEAGIVREQADVTFYAAEVKRLRQLAKDSHAAQSRLDQAQRDLSVARSALSAARARGEQAQEKLQRTGIRAPFAGVVSDRFIEVGEWAESGTAIVRLVDTAALEVRAWVPLTALPFIHPQAELELTVKGRVTRAQVRTLVPVGDERSRLYEMRLSLDDGAWSAGQGVRIAIPTAEPQSAVVIPRDALVLRVDGASVFRILEDNTAERISVIPGIADGDWIAVSGGIESGDRIVVRGGERLRAGDSVSITDLDSKE
jgi:RND family efflux transporter MFP subunit